MRPPSGNSSGMGYPVIGSLRGKQYKMGSPAGCSMIEGSREEERECGAV